MKLRNLHKKTTGGFTTLAATIESKVLGKPREMFFRYPAQYHAFLPENSDPFLPALLIPAMYHGEDLEMEYPVSATLLENQAFIQDIFTTWHPDTFKRIKIIAPVSEEKPGSAPSGNACFFSLGVDSMYTMLKYLPENNPSKGMELTHVIFMKGLELPLSVYEKGQDQAVIETVKKVARHYNLEVIAGETNIRDIFPLDWEDFYFGPGLAATALSLGNGFKNVYIPSSHSYAIFFHDPSSPMIDHLWSTGSTRIFHDGGEKERAQRITDLIMHDPFALAHLRVCVSNDGGNYNCGECWKCIRTMITLEIGGKLKGCGSFPDKLPEFSYLKLKTFNPDSLEFTKENLKLARKYRRKDLEKMLEREVRIGTLDILRNGKGFFFLMKETGWYYFVKLARRLGFFT